VNKNSSEKTSLTQVNLPWSPEEFTKSLQRIIIHLLGFNSIPWSLNVKLVKIYSLTQVNLIPLSQKSTESVRKVRKVGQ